MRTFEPWSPRRAQLAQCMRPRVLAQPLTSAAQVQDVMAATLGAASFTESEHCAGTD
jgi:hypothetical protein